MPLKRIDIVFTTRNEINQNCSFTFFHMDIKKILMVFGGKGIWIYIYCVLHAFILFFNSSKYFCTLKLNDSMKTLWLKVSVFEDKEMLKIDFEIKYMHLQLHFLHVSFYSNVILKSWLSSTRFKCEFIYCFLINSIGPATQICCLYMSAFNQVFHTWFEVLFRKQDCDFWKMGESLTLEKN